MISIDFNSHISSEARGGPVEGEAADRVAIISYDEKPGMRQADRNDPPLICPPTRRACDLAQRP